MCKWERVGVSCERNGKYVRTSLRVKGIVDM